MSAQWPTSVATDSNLYVAVNELQTNLGSGALIGDTTLTLNSTTSFPTVGTVLIDNEVIKYAGVSGATLTGCTRGFDGTTAAAHSSGAIVSFAIVADHHNVLKNEIEAVETYLSTIFGALGSTPLGTTALALTVNGSGVIATSTTTAAELAFVHGVTSAIQTQLNAKASTDLSNVASVSANVPMNSHKFTGLAAGSANGDSIRWEQILGVRVLQVVSANTSTQTSSTSGTFANTALTVSLTPTTTSSKIIVLSFNSVSATSIDGGVQLRTQRTGPATVSLSGAGEYDPSTSGGESNASGRSSISFMDVDSPASLTTCVYTVQIAANRSTGTAFHTAVGTSTIVAIEVG